MKKLVLFLLILSLHVLSKAQFTRGEMIPGVFYLNVHITKNNSVSIEEEVTEFLKDPNCKNYTFVTYSSTLDTIPEFFFQLDWISSLELNNFKPIHINSNFNKLKYIENLRIYGKVSEIDDDVRLPCLRYINIINGVLTPFPNAICQWLSLTEINIQNSKIKIIPSCIGNLSELESLNLSNNRIESVSSEICNLKKLHSIGLSNNRLKELPREICSIKKLESICIDRNRKIKLSDEIKNCLSEKIVIYED